MIISTDKDLKKLQEIGAIVANCLQFLQNTVAPGMNAYELDQIAGDYLKTNGAISAPIFCYKFPGHTCISIGREAAHGIPTRKKIFALGDLINIDVSAVKDGIFADTGASFVLGGGDEKVEALLAQTKKVLKQAISKVEAGKPINTIGKTIEKERGAYTIIQNLCSHGIGKNLHEYPDQIPSYYDAKDKRKLTENMVITIEPFLSTGTTHVDELADGWTLVNQENYISAQFEHTMVVRKSKVPLVVTYPSKSS